MVQWSNLAPEDATWEDYSFLVSQFPNFDPWGQGSFQGKGNVMNSMISELELKLMESQIEEGHMGGAILDYQAENQKLKAT